MEERILEILGEVNEEILSYEGDRLTKDSIIDSFEIINIVSELEEEFDIEIDAKYVVHENFENKDTIIALVKRLVEEQ